MENLSNRFISRTKFLITFSFKDTRKKVVEVQADGAPEISHEEESKADDQPKPISNSCK